MDLEKLVERVTKEIMKMLQASDGKQTVLLVGETENKDMAAALGDQYQVECCTSLANAAAYDYVMLPTSYLYGPHCAALEAVPAPSLVTASAVGGQLDLTGKKLIHERELREKCTSGICTIKVDEKAIITSLAADLIKSRQLTVVRGG